MLIEYDDRGIHYNLPGGGAEPGESILEGLRREVLEEASVPVIANSLAIVYELAPHHQSGSYEPDVQHGLHLIFECEIEGQAEPQMPPTPDLHQSAVRWVPLDELDSIMLIPNIKDQIIAYINNRKAAFVEDHQLEKLYE